MNYFSYNPTTGAYIGQGVANPSPLEPGEYLIPAYATTVQPPTPGVGQYAAFINGTWELLSPWYCTVQGTVWEGESYNIGELMTSSDGTQPTNSTNLLPPTPANGQTLQWSGSAWVLASFDITLSLADAKTFLINAIRNRSAVAVNAEVGLYSSVQLITAPDVNTLESKTYPGTTIGEYQTYVDGLVASSTATINAAVSTTALYSFNPANVPFTPAASGLLSTGRGGDGDGPLDLNNSIYTQFNSTTLTESETELYVPGTSTVISYGVVVPNGFTSNGDCFTPGDYRVQIRQAATGLVLAEFVCPLATEHNEDVAF